MSAAAAAGGSEGVLNYERPREEAAAAAHPSYRGRGNTRFEVSEGDFSGQQLPQAEGVAEHVRLDRVAGALGEHLRGHPAEVLNVHTQRHTGQLLARTLCVSTDKLSPERCSSPACAAAVVHTKHSVLMMSQHTERKSA